jgi:hypothetical protein
LLLVLDNTCKLSSYLGKFLQIPFVKVFLKNGLKILSIIRKDLPGEVHQIMQEIKIGAKRRQVFVEIGPSLDHLRAGIVDSRGPIATNPVYLAGRPRTEYGLFGVILERAVEDASAQDQPGSQAVLRNSSVTVIDVVLHGFIEFLGVARPGHVEYHLVVEKI